MPVLTVPDDLPANPTPEQTRRHSEAVQIYQTRYREQTLMTIGLVSAVCFVFIGGIFVVCQINDGELKLGQLQIELTALQGKHDDAVMAHTKAIKDMDAQHRLMLQNHTNSTVEQVKEVFKDMCNATSPSIALVYNDTEHMVDLKATHTYGWLGGAVGEPYPYQIRPGHFKVVEGNVFSSMLGSGISVKRSETVDAWKTLSHTEIIDMKVFDKRAISK